MRYLKPTLCRTSELYNFKALSSGVVDSTWCRILDFIVRVKRWDSKTWFQTYTSQKYVRCSIYDDC